MLDSLTAAEVTETPPPLHLSPQSQAPIQAHPRYQATHWTRRLNDAVGTALQKLKLPHRPLEGAGRSGAEASPAAVSSEHSAATSQPEMLLQALAFENLQQPDAPAVLSELDRRGFPRRSSECSVAVLERSQTHELTPQEIDRWLAAGSTAGKVLDISQSGLCLQWHREIASDTEIVLRISNQKLNRHVDSVAKVIHSRHTGHGRYSIHCQVLNPLTAADLQDLGRPPLAAGHVLA